jgi:glutathione S-transferase
MRLYSSATSPFVRKVLVVLHETGLIDEVELVPSGGTPVAPGTIPVERNPLGKLPTLERNDGTALYDSRVICRYLDDLGGGRLYPGKPRLWETLTLEATGDGMMEAAVLMIYEVRARPEAHRDGPWVESQWAKVARALDALEARWLSHLAGPLDAAQIAVGCALGYLDFRFDARGWRAGRPALAAWAARFAERPAMQATRPAA